MQVANVSGMATNVATQTSSAASASHTSTLDYNAFLKLLLAQMKSQDPTNPTDSTQWVSQLATFSNVEQAVQSNAKLDQILSASNFARAEGLIGHTVASADGSVSGIVKSVKISSTGAIATLENGKTLDVSSDISVS